MRTELFEEIKRLASEIVGEFAPTELEDLTLLADTFVHSASHGSSAELRADDSDAFGFGLDIETGMLCVHILAGTLALAEAVISTRRIKEERLLVAQVRDAWKQFLTSKGVPPELAEAIPVKFGAKMISLLEGENDSRTSKP